MALILDNSRDVGDKFMFGHFMMNSDFSVPPTKRKPDAEKAWVYLMKKDKAKDYDLDGEVFAHPGKGNVKGHKTWRVMDGANKKAKVTTAGVTKWIAKEMLLGANGIAVWLDGWTHSKKFLEKVGKVCKQFKVKAIGFVESYAKDSDGKVPKGYDDFEDCAKALNDIFDVVIIYNFVDNWISFDDTIKDWKKAGYKKILGCMQDTYSKDAEEKKYGAWVELHDGYAVWKNLAGYCKFKEIPFCLYDPKTTDEDTPKRLTILKDIFSGDKVIPAEPNNNWGSYEGIVGPGEGEEGTNEDPDDPYYTST